jgi:murein L,D-transpeptidase YcbB/YkuD
LGVFSSSNGDRTVLAALSVAALGVGLAAVLSSGPASGQSRPPSAPALQAPATASAALPATDPAAVQLKPEQVRLLIDALAQAEVHGFAPGAFATGGLESLLGSADPQVRQAAQAQLVSRVLLYARAVHAGRLADGDFLEDWGVRPGHYDPGPSFIQAAARDQLKGWLEDLPPPYTGYDALTQGLRIYREIAGKGGWKPVSSGPPLKPGAKDPRVIELRTRLAAEDPSVMVSDDPTYDDALVQAVMRAQKRYGLKDDGSVGGQTLAVLNVPVEKRIAQIMANMERWRWLPPELPTDRIQVNVAAAVLTVFHSDTPVMSMRAVTGRPGDETPMLTSQIESIVFNPPWNVPTSIATKELWPKERANPGYLQAHDFVIVPTDGGGSRLQQRAGPQSALGRIKFDFPNTYGVYLHDTPSRGLFDAFARLASHGCVRLQRPLELAKLVMQGEEEWTPEAIDDALAGGKTVRAHLSRPISVFLLYWTAYMGPDGMMNFREDPYGWDAELAERLRAPTLGGAA